ncbi:phage portal protein [Paucisalibacillus globulus]|uniref:phage portal protein n=1 Tax=Paucisalibacillus globulus TaxID=351095 RepID=UPI000BB80C34|nr:phage portal protein [Paucisalibacillus globulus]
MRNIGLFDVFKKNSELELMLDLDLLEGVSDRIQMKQMAIQTCINLIAKTISMSEFRVKKRKEYIKNETYYRLNVKPNLNQAAATFWEQVIYKYVYDNECLIIITDTQDLLVADSFTKKEYAVYGDVFTDVVVKGHEFRRSFKRDEVFYIEFNNKNLTPIMDGLYADYGELFGRTINAHKRKSQIRGTVDIEGLSGTTDEKREKIQKFVDKVYKAFTDKDIAVVPQQKGFKYQEHSKYQQSLSVDEVDKVADGFLKKVARALNIPPALVLGEMADVEKPTRNFMLFCIDPIVKKIKDEFTGKMFTRTEFFEGEQIDIRRPSYRDIFDLAAAVDKLRAGGMYNGNELRDKLGDEPVDDPILERYYITKNYTEDSLEGGGTDE